MDILGVHQADDVLHVRAPAIDRNEKPLEAGTSRILLLHNAISKLVGPWRVKNTISPPPSDGVGQQSVHSSSSFSSRQRQSHQSLREGEDSA